MTVGVTGLKPPMGIIQCLNIGKTLRFQMVQQHYSHILFTVMVRYYLKG